MKTKLDQRGQSHADRKKYYKKTIITTSPEEYENAVLSNVPRDNKKAAAATGEL